MPSGVEAPRPQAAGALREISRLRFAALEMTCSLLLESCPVTLLLYNQRVWT